MTQADKLRAQRATLIADRKEARANFIAARAAAEQKILESRQALDREEAALQERGAGFDADIAALDREIGAAEADDKIESLRAVAADLDTHGHSPERLRNLERLCCELSSPMVNRFAMRSYEARSLCFRRMKREGDAVVYRPPYPTWAALVEANVRSEAIPSAVPQTEKVPKQPLLADQVPERLKARDCHSERAA
jgi:hypothetical protein